VYSDDSPCEPLVTEHDWARTPAREFTPFNVFMCTKLYTSYVLYTIVQKHSTINYKCKFSKTRFKICIILHCTCRYEFTKYLLLIKCKNGVEHRSVVKSYLYYCVKNIWRKNTATSSQQYTTTSGLLIHTVIISCGIVHNRVGIRIRVLIWHRSKINR